MKAKTAKRKIDKIANQAVADGDGFIGIYFSHEEEKAKHFIGTNVGMDKKDAELVVRNLISMFDLDVEELSNYFQIVGKDFLPRQR